MSSDDDGIYSNDNADAYFTDQVMDDEFDTQYSSELDILPDLRPKQRRKRVIPDDYATLGGASVNCRHCGALMGNQRNPIFSICCRKGEVKIPPLPQTPPYLIHLYNDEFKSAAFQRCTRLNRYTFVFYYKKKWKKITTDNYSNLIFKF
ncbi:uncharacterized protein LOC141684406 [Apium graveolens]|uniref:uncharacterized protein LOC141684406 n=1 Tax=Apium graveolens TaxID=4045 RepID=UPI003D7A2731